MKKKILILSGAFLLGSLAVGAVKTLVIAPRTVADANDILEKFYEIRSSLPPLPSPVDYKTVVSQLSEARCDFLSAPNWAFNHVGGTLYLSEKSALKVELPMQMVAYEDLISGKVVLTGTTIGSKNIQTLAVVDAPEFTEQKAGQTVESWLMEEISPRRMIWTALLKSEDEVWADSLSAQEQALSMPMPITMSMLIPTSVDALTLAIDRTNVTVCVPDGFTNHVEIYKTTNLVSDIWDIATQNLTPTSTNPATWNFTETGSVGFFQAGNMDIDTDNDDIPDAREIVVHNTDPEDSDSDDDQIGDYAEIHVYFTDPNNDDVSKPVISLVAPDTGERKVLLP